METWLANLKVGDRVIVAGVEDYVTTVDRLTKTLIILKNKTRFNKDGHPPGSWSRTYLEEPTEERVNVIRQANLAWMLHQYDWKKLPLETLRKVRELMQNSS